MSNLTTSNMSYEEYKVERERLDTEATQASKTLNDIFPSKGRPYTQATLDNPEFVNLHRAFSVAYDELVAFNASAPKEYFLRLSTPRARKSRG